LKIKYIEGGFMNSKRLKVMSADFLRALYEMSIRECWTKEEFDRHLANICESPSLKKYSKEEREIFIEKYVKGGNSSSFIHLVIEKQGCLRKPNFATCVVCNQIFNLPTDEIKVIKIFSGKVSKGEEEAHARHSEEEIRAAVMANAPYQKK
jgi:hypothetical protein